MSQARQTKVAAAVKSIRLFHALGQSLPKKQAHKDAYNQGTVDSEAKRHGINADTARKARQFADPVAGYTPAEVKELCQLILDVQSDQDDGYAVFGRTHLIRLLSVQKNRRAALQKAAIQGGWSTGELEAQIAARYGSRRDGGRKRRLPNDALGLLTQVERLCESWRRWIELMTPDQAAKTNALSLDDLPKPVRRLAREAGVAVAKLHEAVTNELKARRPSRCVRHQFRKAADAENDRH